MFFNCAVSHDCIHHLNQTRLNSICPSGWIPKLLLTVTAFIWPYSLVSAVAGGVCHTVFVLIPALLGDSNLEVLQHKCLPLPFVGL